MLIINEGVSLMQPIYRYFVQPQINTATDTVFGYELLIKELTPDGWRLPANFTALSSEILSGLLVATTRVLTPKVRSVSVNLNRQQLIDEQAVKAVLQSQIHLYPAKLTVELTEEICRHSSIDIPVLSHLLKFANHGMQISLDDVGTGLNDFHNVQKILPLVSEVKFALQNFDRNIEDLAIQQKLHFWHAISNEYNLRFILEGIEDDSDACYSDNLKIHLRQGYYYGKPELLKLPGDSF